MPKEESNHVAYREEVLPEEVAEGLAPALLDLLHAGPHSGNGAGGVIPMLR